MASMDKNPSPLRGRTYGHCTVCGKHRLPERLRTLEQDSYSIYHRHEPRLCVFIPHTGPNGSTVILHRRICRAGETVCRHHEMADLSATTTEDR